MSLLQGEPGKAGEDGKPGNAGPPGADVRACVYHSMMYGVWREGWTLSLGEVMTPPPPPPGRARPHR